MIQIDSGDGDDFNTGDNAFSDGDGGDDTIDSGDGNDQNVGDNVDGSGDGDDKINAGQGDDISSGGDGSDKFQCGSGIDTTDFDEAEGDKATGNCEDVEKGNGKNK